MVSGISFTLQAFSNVNGLNIMQICLTATVVGFVIFNLFYAIFKFVSKLSGKDVDNKGYFIFVDVAFIALIVFFVFLLK